MAITFANVINADAADIATITTDVNTNRAGFTPPLAALTNPEIIAGLVQVGFSALSDRNGDVYTSPTIHTISIFGEPSSSVVITLDDTLFGHITDAATELGVADTDVVSLACHVGVLMLNGTALPPYRCSFV